MNAKLSEFTGSAPVIAMLGMCKNAGKTKALNRLIYEYQLPGRSIAVTSVGRDGERTDLVTGTDKPPIYMHRGMLAATASDLLPLSDVSREILDVTDIATPLGIVVVFKARSDGYAQLAGPSIIEDLSRLIKRLHGFGAETVIIDGAMNRRSPAAGALDGACVLCTGASLNKDMGIVVSETAFVCKLLTLPERRTDITRPGEQWDFGIRNSEFGISDKDIGMMRGQHSRRYTVLYSDNALDTDTVEDLCTILKRSCPESIFFSGAFTESAARAIMQSGAKIDGLLFIVEDSSKILLAKETFEKLQGRSAGFMVKRSTMLAAVTINPISAGGWRFDADIFLEEMKRAANVPVLNVGK